MNWGENIKGRESMNRLTSNSLGIMGFEGLSAQIDGGPPMWLNAPEAE